MDIKLPIQQGSSSSLYLAVVTFHLFIHPFIHSFIDKEAAYLHLSTMSEKHEDAIRPEVHQAEGPNGFDESLEKTPVQGKTAEEAKLMSVLLFSALHVDHGDEATDHD